VKLVYLVGFITKKFVTTHGHTNVKWMFICHIGLWSLITSLELLLEGTHCSLHLRLSSRC